MRTVRKSTLLLVTLLVTVLTALTGGATTAAGGDRDWVKLNGISTTLVTDRATTGVLVQNGIIPLPVKPAWVRPAFPGGEFALAYSFPITGGRVDSDTLAGKIRHSGGLRFLNLANFESLKLTNFKIITKGEPGLTAEVNGDHDTRVRILDLDLSGAEIDRDGRVIKIAGVDATLTQTAADALNATLGVSFFAAGIDLGDAYVKVRVDK